MAEEKLEKIPPHIQKIIKIYEENAGNDRRLEIVFDTPEGDVGIVEFDTLFGPFEHKGAEKKDI